VLAAFGEQRAKKADSSGRHRIRSGSLGMTYEKGVFVSVFPGRLIAVFLGG
jgi:hypothetical protein